VPHLRGGDRRMLAKLGSQRRVGSAQRVEGDAIGDRWSIRMSSECVGEEPPESGRSGIG
jgi:hypothetical protein